MPTCCGAAFADEVVTNFWTGGNSAGGGWATPGNWSAGVPTEGQVIAFRNGDVVSMNNDDVPTAIAVAGIDLAGSGTTLADVNRLLKQFESTRKVMKNMTTQNPMAARLMKKKKKR